MRFFYYGSIWENVGQRLNFDSEIHIAPKIKMARYYLGTVTLMLKKSEDTWWA